MKVNYDKIEITACVDIFSYFNLSRNCAKKAFRSWKIADHLTQSIYHDLRSIGQIGSRTLHYNIRSAALNWSL